MIQTGFFTLLVLVAATTLANATLAISHKGLIVCGNSLGCLKGVYMPGYQIKRFEAYLGIPYALPPVGELRFSVSEDWRILESSLIILCAHAESQSDAQTTGCLQCQQCQAGLHTEELFIAKSLDLWPRGLPVLESL